MFLRSMESGGIFVGVYRIDCHDEATQTTVSAQLQGSYGLFNASAALTMSNIAKNSNVSIFCSMYQEGGPPLTITNPHDPTELINHSNAWITAINNNPKDNSRPTSYLASPIVLAAGPPALNAADIINAADVLSQCSVERLRILDQLNLLQAVVDDPPPGRFQFTAPTTMTNVKDALAAASADLDTVHRTASQAMNQPKLACLPAVFAKQNNITYPSLVMPTPFPALPPGTPPVVGPTAISRESFAGTWTSTDVGWNTTTLIIDVTPAFISLQEVQGSSSIMPVTNASFDGDLGALKLSFDIENSFGVQVHNDFTVVMDATDHTKLLQSITTTVPNPPDPAHAIAPFTNSSHWTKVTP